MSRPTPCPGPDPDPAELLRTELDDLEMLPYADPAAALRRGADAEVRARGLGVDDLVQRARLVVADAQIRQGDLAAGAGTARQVAVWAGEHDARPLLARCDRLLASFFSRIGDASSSLLHAVRALDHAGTPTSPRVEVDYLMTLAVALGGTGAYAEARRRLLEAEELAVRLDDPALQLAVLNNLAYTEHLAGQGPEALAAVARLQAVAAARGAPLQLTFVDTIARAQLSCGMVAEAQRTLLEGVADPVVADGDADALPEALLTLALVHRLQGELGQAARVLERCDVLCRRGDLTSLGTDVLRERAELLAAGGDHRRAYEQFKEFHEASRALFDAERDARAKLLHAVFETEQARRDTDRFRELSERDALTELFNRRYVEDRVPALLLGARTTGTPVSLALVDLDHFKQVNDSLSHETGDRVLQELARRLEVTAERAGAGAFAARLGGDEFVLVLPEVAADAAVQLCGDLPRLVLAGRPVTTSTGISALSSLRTTLAQLLAGADAALYRAKQAGRACIVVEAPPVVRPSNRCPGDG